VIESALMKRAPINRVLTGFLSMPAQLMMDPSGED
jgi:hypothetical protein